MGLSYGKGYVPQSATQCVVDAIGDSNTYSAWNPTPWFDLLPIALNGLPGGGGALMRQNLGVSSTKASDWGTAGGSQDVAAKSFVGADYVCILLGTNDGSARATADFLQNLTYIANKVIADGAIPVFGIFQFWANTALSGVTGVATAPPSQVQRLRHAMLNWAVSQGYPVALVQAAFGDNIRMLADNIHIDEMGAAIIAKAFAQAIARHRVKQVA
jgi:lysophospholipase L1-like esterase